MLQSLLSQNFRIHIAGEESKAALSSLLSKVESCVRILQEEIYLLSVQRIERHSETCRNEYFSSINHHRSRKSLEEVAGYFGSHVSTPNLREDDRKLVASQAGRCSIVSKGSRKRLAHRGQNPISKTMSHSLVDILEAIQVNQHNTYKSTVDRVRNRLLQPPLEQDAIWQARERIILGEARQSFLGFFELRNIREDCNVMRDFIVVASNCAD